MFPLIQFVAKTLTVSEVELGTDFILSAAGRQSILACIAPCFICMFYMPLLIYVGKGHGQKWPTRHGKP